MKTVPHSCAAVVINSKYHFSLDMHAVTVVDAVNSNSRMISLITQHNTVVFMLLKRLLQIMAVES